MLFLKSISNLCGSTPWPLSPDTAAYVELLQAGQFSMVAQGAMWIWQVSFPSCKTGVVTACWAGHTLLSPRSTLSPERLIATTCTLWSFCLLTLGWVAMGGTCRRQVLLFITCPVLTTAGSCASLCAHCSCQADASTALALKCLLITNYCFSAPGSTLQCQLCHDGQFLLRTFPLQGVQRFLSRGR